MQTSLTRRQEYRMGTGMRTGLLILGLAIGGVGIVPAYLSATNAQKQFPLVLILVPIAIGGFVVALALRSRLVIEGTRFEVRSIFTEKSADLNEVEGYRTISSRNGSYWQMRLKQGRGTINVSKSYDCQGVREWLAQIPNLDEQDRKALLDQIEQNQELGATPEERLARLGSAKTLNIALSTIAVAAAIGFGFGGDAWHLPTALVLGLLPGVLVYLISTAPLLYAIFKPKRDPRTDLTIAFMACGMGLVLGNHGVHFVETQKMLMYAGLVGLLCCAGIFASAQKNPQIIGVTLGMLFLAGFYGWGLASAADILPDRSEAVRYTTMVEGKHESHGRSTSYYLDLAPWGPMQASDDVSVSKSIYDSAWTGGAVCLELHQGILRVQWYRMVSCDASAQ